ncbi:Fc.00g089610.m01.CDS01 [Cosmosporella sp. VM-42]
MSDTEATGKAMAWTEEAKFQFLLRIVAQYKDDGKAINWSRVQMAGRTTKSLQNMWTKINKQVADLEAEQNGSAPPTPAKKATPRKKAPKKEPVAEDDEDGDAEAVTPKKTPRKRAAPGTATKRGKKAKKESDEDASVPVTTAEASTNGENVKSEVDSD